MRVVALIPAVVLMALVWAADLPATLGVHPWWSGKVVWIASMAALAGILATLSDLVQARIRTAPTN